MNRKIGLSKLLLFTELILKNSVKQNIKFLKLMSTMKMYVRHQINSLFCCINNAMYVPIIIIIIKISDACPIGKTERLQYCRATPQAPAPLKKKKTDAKEADYD